MSDHPWRGEYFHKATRKQNRRLYERLDREDRERISITDPMFVGLYDRETERLDVDQAVRDLINGTISGL